MAHNSQTQADQHHEAASPVEDVTPLGEDAVRGDPEAQHRTECHHCRQQQVEVPAEHGVTQEPGCQVRQDHQHRVEKHLTPQQLNIKGSYW